MEQLDFIDIVAVAAMVGLLANPDIDMKPEQYAREAFRYALEFVIESDAFKSVLHELGAAADKEEVKAAMAARRA